MLLNLGEIQFKELWRNASKSAYFCFILCAYFAWRLYFKRLKFGDLTPIHQIRPSFHSSKFLVLQYIHAYQCFEIVVRHRTFSDQKCWLSEQFWLWSDKTSRQILYDFRTVHIFIHIRNIFIHQLLGLITHNAILCKSYSQNSFVLLKIGWANYVNVWPKLLLLRQYILTYFLAYFKHWHIHIHTCVLMYSTNLSRDKTFAVT